MFALFSGLFTGLSLIVAIGAQNAFVIRQGLTKRYVPLVVIVCTLSDATLIALGTGGLGKLIQDHKTVLEIVRWFGVAYLLWFGFSALRRAFANQSMAIEGEGSFGAVATLLATLALTWLNPHVYLDTVILMGSIANQFAPHKWLFAFGGMLGSALWFSLIGFGAKAASRFMSKPIMWKIMDYLIAAIMAIVALYLALHKFN